MRSIEIIRVKDSAPSMLKDSIKTIVYILSKDSTDHGIMMRQEKFLQTPHWMLNGYSDVDRL